MFPLVGGEFTFELSAMVHDLKLKETIEQGELTDSLVGGQ